MNTHRLPKTCDLYQHWYILEENTVMAEYVRLFCACRKNREPWWWKTCCTLGSGLTEMHVISHLCGLRDRKNQRMFHSGTPRFEVILAAWAQHKGENGVPGTNKLQWLSIVIILLPPHTPKASPDLCLLSHMEVRLQTRSLKLEKAKYPGGRSEYALNGGSMYC